MAAQPFPARATEPAGLLQRLFWRRAGTRALAELADRLARAERPTDVSELDVARIAEAHGFDPVDRFPGELARLYRSYLEFCLVDRHLDGEEVAALEHLKHLFRLADREVRAIHDSTARRVYGHSVAEVVEDGEVTAAERDFLRSLQRELQLPDAVARRIYDDAAHGRLRVALSDALADERLSDAEHDELRAMGRSLGVRLDMDDATRRVFQRIRLYWLIENGDPPALPCDVRLHRYERCLASRRVAWIPDPRSPEPRRSGPIGRARAATSTFLRPLAIGARHLPDDATATPGRLYLTDHRILFAAARGRRTSLRLSRIADFRPYADGIQLQLQARSGPFIRVDEDVDLLGLKLDRALRERRHRGRPPA